MSGIGYVPSWLPTAPAPAPSPPPKTARTARPLLARYDAAQDSPTDRHHWNHADDLSAVGANSQAVRLKLRRRSRYECANNSYLAGLLATMAHDLIGSGPRVQITVPAPPSDAPADSLRADELNAAAREVERAFAAWMRDIRLTEKLRTMAVARWRDGEVFALFATNRANKTPVTLDVRPFECDHVTDPFGTVSTPGADYDDGITYDADGNPVSYVVLTNHPGDLTYFSVGTEFRTYPADVVLHWFRCDRPGQRRGLPATTPMLPLGAQLRRYTLATLASAEYAASVAGVLETDVPATDANGNPTLDTFDEIEVIRGKLLTTPLGWKLSQLDAAQPTSTYGDFKKEILNEMGRPFCAPFNVIAGNSSGYNYSSGRLDHQIYHRAVWDDRDDAQRAVLDRIFAAWLAEAEGRGLVPASLPDPATWQVNFHWDGFTSIDPLKDANAAAAELSLGLTTRSELLAARGLDWKENIDQLAAERAYMAERGLNPDAGTKTAVQPAASPTGDEDRPAPAGREEDADE